MWNNVTNFEEHTSGTPLYTPTSWYIPGKFWYTLGCTIHSVDKHCSRQHEKLRGIIDTGATPSDFSGDIWAELVI